MFRVMALCFGLVPTGTFAQLNTASPDQCPSGFADLGVGASEDYSEWASEAKINTEKWIFVFRASPIDTSFHQGPGESSFNGGSASAVMTYRDVPPGFLVLAAGDAQPPMSGICRGWSVHKPVIEENQMTIDLYCHSGSNTLCFNATNYCSAKVRVCQKVP